MSEAVGFDITPDSSSSLRKILKYNLESHLEDLDSISAAASKVRQLQCTCTLYMYMCSDCICTLTYMYMYM